MSTQEAIQYVDLRDQMRKQFSNTEVDFFHINYNLKMIDIKQLDRIYFQTSALPYYKSQMKKSTGSKSSDVTSPLPRSHQTSSSDVTASLPPSHQTSSGKSCHTRNSSNFEENSIKSPSSHSGRNGYRSIPQSPQDGHSRQYDVVFGNSTDNNGIYHVYRHSQAHVLDDIHNLVLEKIKLMTLLL
uniref:Uncharacterized protein n=1 Tax=Cacopsylla melanoneura TaxID=428564 RepID=A0A8D8PZD4_9HEMI